MSLGLVTGCGSMLDNEAFQLKEAAPSVASAEVIPKDKITSPQRKLAAEGIDALSKNDLKTASLRFNQALKMDIRNSYLQFFNALTYHLRARRGDPESFALAEQGYRIAIGFDPSNWLAPFYLGHLYMDQRRFAAAQDEFARAAYLRSDDAEILYQLAAASYYAGDPVSADGALRQMRRLGDSPQGRARLLQALVVTNAAANRPQDARTYLSQYAALVGGDKADHLENRVRDWREFFVSAASAAPDGGRKSAKNTRTAQFIDSDDAGMNRQPPSSFVDSPPFDQQYSLSPAEEQKLNTFADQGMVVVDVAIIGTEEDTTNSAGVNLLSGLRIQFGDPFSNIAGYSVRNDKVRDYVDRTNDTRARTVTSMISIPSISYSLNIANSDASKNEILAKPSLVALNGEVSEFFSGVDVNAAAVSGAAGDSVRIEKEIGVKLQVRPEILPNDMVKLNVTAERTFLTQPSQSVVFQFRLDTSKTSVNANVALKFGQTLILSGLSEREIERNRDGVPGLQDIPIVQYAFSRAEKRTFKKSVLILLTPHRPQYMNETPHERRENMSKLSERERAIERLANRHRDWFQPNPNLTAVFRHLETNQLYEEFRNGDFPLEEWQDTPGHDDRLKAAMNWLYY